MKRYLMALMIAAVAASTAFAQEGNEDEPHHPGKSWDNDQGGKPDWGQRDDQNRGRGDKQAWGQDKRGGEERPDGPMTPAMMEQMKTDHQAIRKLGEAARAETDETKKAELVAQIRAKLGEVADRMQTVQAQRLAQAEERLAALKQKIEEGKAKRDARIEEQVQRILSGERPQRPDRFKDFPQAKGGRGGHGEMPPPPPAEDMPEDMPPPPED